MEDQNLIKRLKEEWQYPDHLVSTTISRIKAMDKELQDAFDSFLKVGRFPPIPSYFGLNPLAISSSYPFKPPAVFLCLDWIRRDPQKALDALVEEYHKPLPKSFRPEEFREYMNNHTNE